MEGPNPTPSCVSAVHAKGDGTKNLIDWPANGKG